MTGAGRSAKVFSLAAVVVLLILGFAGQTFGSKTPKFVYVSNLESNDISAYTINATTGALSPVPGSPFAAAGRAPGSVAVDPSGKFAYVANRGTPISGSVSAYTIDSTTGALSPVPGSPFAAGTGPSSVAVDPSGKFAYVPNICVTPGNCSSGNVSAYNINATTGALSPISGSPFAAGTGPSSVAVDPSGKFAYVANGTSNDISAYTINATTGALSPVPGSPFAAAGRGTSSVAVDPSGKFAYANGFGFDGVTFYISAYTINSTTGALSPISGSPFPAGVYPSSVAVDPSGKFAYVANLDGSVSAYTINATTGALSPISGSPFAAGMYSTSVAVDPSGKFAYVANGNSKDISAYTINATTGALSPVPGSPFAAGTFPLSVAIASESASPIQVLVNSLTDLINSLNLPPQLKSQLLRFVQQIPTAISSLTPAQKAAAIANLRIFITQMERLQSFRLITETKEEQLISLANQAIAALS